MITTERASFLLGRVTLGIEPDTDNEEEDQFVEDVREDLEQTAKDGHELVIPAD